MHSYSLLRRAVLVGFIAGAVCLISRMDIGPGAWDLTWALRGAALLAAGQNPYTTGGYPFDLPLFYPLPALFALLPLAWLDPSLASTLFSGISAAVLAWAVLRERKQAWPMFVSAPFFIAVVWSQWAPLLTAAALLPSLLPLALAKPNLGLPILLSRRPSWRSILICAALMLMSIVILPSWPLDWLQNTKAHDSAMPLLSVPGALLVCALLAWRDSRARLLTGLALMPQRFYDPLLLWTIPETVRGGLALSALSWIVCGPWLLFETSIPLSHPPQWSVVGLLYLPALVMVLWRVRDVAWPGTPTANAQITLTQQQSIRE
jgi:hypothetical protein